MKFTKEEFYKMSYNETNKISTFPRPTSFLAFKEARQKHLCDTCGQDIEREEMYALIKKVFGSDFTRHHIVCPSEGVNG